MGGGGLAPNGRFHIPIPTPSASSPTPSRIDPSPIHDPGDTHPAAFSTQGNKTENGSEECTDETHGPAADPHHQREDPQYQGRHAHPGTATASGSSRPGVVIVVVVVVAPVLVPSSPVVLVVLIPAILVASASTRSPVVPRFEHLLATAALNLLPQLGRVDPEFCTTGWASDLGHSTSPAVFERGWGYGK